LQWKILFLTKKEMKLIQLRKDKFVKVDDEDFEWINKLKWYASPSTGSLFYAKRFDSNKGERIAIFMHREILGKYQEINSSHIVDHINRDGLDNRKVNLRVCNRSQNSANTKLNKRNTSGFRGVTWDKEKKRWRATLMNNGKNFRLGRFKLKEMAALKCEGKLIEIYGEFVNLN
jgi:hypothetical protein